MSCGAEIEKPPQGSVTSHQPQSALCCLYHKSHHIMMAIPCSAGPTKDSMHTSHRLLQKVRPRDATNLSLPCRAAFELDNLAWLLKPGLCMSIRASRWPASLQYKLQPCEWCFQGPNAHLALSGCLPASLHCQGPLCDLDPSLPLLLQTLPLCPTIAHTWTRLLLRGLDSITKCSSQPILKSRAG